MKKLNIMRKSIFLLLITFFSAQFILTAQSVQKENEIVFIFENKETISKHFSDKVNQKVIDFTIKGIESKSQIDDLKTKISSYRGVNEFVIGDVNAAKEYSAKITLYEYADHWMYYKFLFLNCGIKKVMLNGELFNSESLSNL